jgi:hypothetical protein
MKTAVRAGLLAAAISATAPASALAFVNVGDTQTYLFNGIVEEVVVPGLSARLDLTFDGYVGNNAKFSYTLTNTSGGAITNSRVSVFGFDVVTDGFSLAGSSETSALFQKTNDGAFPQTQGGPREFCMTAATGGNPACTNGGGNGVFQPSSESATFTLAFGSLPGSVELGNLIVRYQSIDSPTLGLRGASGIGVGGIVPTRDIVPEPATWAMMIAGFGLVGASLRRRTTGLARLSA